MKIQALLQVAPSSGDSTRRGIISKKHTPIIAPKHVSDKPEFKNTS